MGKLNMANLFTIFLLVVIALALTPTVVDQVGYVTGTGGDNLTGALISIMFYKSIIMITLSVSVGEFNSAILGNHNLVNRRWCGIYAIQRELKTIRHLFVGRFFSIFSPAFLGYA